MSEDDLKFRWIEWSGKGVNILCSQSESNKL